MTRIQVGGVYCAACNGLAWSQKQSGERDDGRDERGSERLTKADRRLASMDKSQRIELVNRLIERIAGCGRGFFRNDKTGKIARIELDDRGRLWWVNEWYHLEKHRRLCMSVGRNHLLMRGFHNGGTLRCLVIAFLGFIRTGEPINANCFGPWPDWYGEGDLWGYGRDVMAKIRAAAIDMGVAAEPTNQG